MRYPSRREDRSTLRRIERHLNERIRSECYDTNDDTKHRLIRLEQCSLMLDLYHRTLFVELRTILNIVRYIMIEHCSLMCDIMRIRRIDAVHT